MAQERIHIIHWGSHRTPDSNLPAYAILTDADHSRIAAVCRAIERKTGRVIGNCRLDAHDRSTGRTQYQLTLCRRPRGSDAALSVEDELWVSI